VLRCVTPKPRNVTATEDERQKLLSGAALNLRCWLLLCSDLAIRSGTASALGPSNYDRKAGTLTFTTKYNNTQRLKVTSELRKLLDMCNEPSLPFIAQLSRGTHWRRSEPLAPMAKLKPCSMHNAYHALKKKCGITRKLTPHDLRRTTARRIYEMTGDLRQAQALLGHSDLSSTLWYLQDELVNVEVSTLELAKLNPQTERVQ
jgi:integrase